jgi:hypothetical protein
MPRPRAFRSICSVATISVVSCIPGKKKSAAREAASGAEKIDP